jgi:hypothetical protein
MGVVQDVFDYLEAQGITAGSTEWEMTRRREMDEPAEDQLVVLTEDGGPAPEMKASEGIGDSATHDPGVHVLVRAAQWQSDDSFAKALEIYEALHGLLDVTLVSGSDTYMRIRARTAGPIFIGFDAQGRPRHTIAFSLLLEQQ